ncbi:hypothetical protein FHP25_24960 [Vineibacter terrae]|uniref:Uncharacterized protein n=1 Tax=Vineibacter terrae TaxID=2586908 RepID=A0A5C8PFH2_9HYPH|nr:hypothetical protein [Vineibacter terrae]TXL72549.1 hypothetical protein FHP25_24960 [Vineibacter terrae]
MAWTQTDADRIRKAIAQGVLEVEHDNKRVRYRSLDEMQRTLTMIEGELGTAAGKAPVRQFRFVSTKGL